MAIGTGTKVIGGVTVEVGQAHRRILGGGGLESQGLTVKLRSKGGYKANTPTRSSHPLNLLGNTIIRKPVLKTGARNPIHRASTKRPVLGPIGTKPRNIT